MFRRFSLPEAHSLFDSLILGAVLLMLGGAGPLFAQVFTPGGVYPTAGTSSAMITADFNGDSYPDIAFRMADEDTVFIHDSAVVDNGAEIGAGTKIWHFTHVREGVKIGEGCNIGQNVYIGKGVKIGRGVKIQNNVSVYEGVEIGDYVFLGPSAVLTNVINPRSEFPRKHEYKKTIIEDGATVGANATIVCGVTLGRSSFIGGHECAGQSRSFSDASVSINAPTRSPMPASNARSCLLSTFTRCPLD